VKVPHPAFRGLALCACITWLASDARAETPAPAPLPTTTAATLPAAEPPASALPALAESLAHPNRAIRAQTVHALSTLAADQLPDVQRRLADLAHRRPPREEVMRILALLRRLSGSRSPDDEVDLALGVHALLDRERGDTARAVLEPLLFLRAIERMEDSDAKLALASWLELDSAAWEPELRLSHKRMGLSFLPALVALRSHDSPRVRRFAQAQLHTLGMDEPRLALMVKDPYLLGRLIRAYVSPPDYAAMPLIVRMAGDVRIQVRDAARQAIARYGKNAIWQVRELYEEVSGQRASRAWDSERTALELYAVLDRAGLEDAQSLFARGQLLERSGELVAMQHEYDALLAKHPQFEQRALLAPGYAALAGQLFSRDALEASLAAYNRALRLDPAASQAKHWRAQTAYVSAELALTRGVVDLTGYRRALELDPQLRGARDAIDRLSGSRAQRQRNLKRNLALAAGALLLLAAVLLVRRSPTPQHRTETRPVRSSLTADPTEHG